MRAGCFKTALHPTRELFQCNLLGMQLVLRIVPDVREAGSRPTLAGVNDAIQEGETQAWK